MSSGSNKGYTEAERLALQWRKLHKPERQQQERREIKNRRREERFEDFNEKGKYWRRTEIVSKDSEVGIEQEEIDEFGRVKNTNISNFNNSEVKGGNWRDNRERRSRSRFNSRSRRFDPRSRSRSRSRSGSRSRAMVKERNRQRSARSRSRSRSSDRFHRPRSGNQPEEKWGHDLFDEKAAIENEYVFFFTFLYHLSSRAILMFYW